jgi:hypothetical protein
VIPCLQDDGAAAKQAFAVRPKEEPMPKSKTTRGKTTRGKTASAKQLVLNRESIQVLVQLPPGVGVERPPLPIATATLYTSANHVPSFGCGPVPFPYDVGPQVVSLLVAHATPRDRAFAERLLSERERDLAIVRKERHLKVNPDWSELGALGRRLRARRD